VTLRSAGLTNLRVEVVLPHCTSTACNLSAPDSSFWAYRLRTCILIHAISVVKVLSAFIRMAWASNRALAGICVVKLVDGCQHCYSCGRIPDHL